jgi:hypothetical protein
MKEHPILFTGDMVRAILDGRKTETRRMIKPQPNTEIACLYYQRIGSIFRGYMPPGEPADVPDIKCPYGSPGDHLWVRETFQPHPEAGVIYPEGCIPSNTVCYAADFSKEDYDICKPWRTSIHMPRWASRITLEVVDIRVERVQDITVEGAKAEAAVCHPGDYVIGQEDRDITKFLFGALWDSINKKRGYSWESNPLIWVVQFKRI